MKELIEQLKRHEGYRQFPYTDTVGKLTVGIGFNLDDVGLSEFESEMILNIRLLKLESKLSAFSWFNKLNRARKDAIINMAYNLGERGLMQFRNMINALGEENFSEASREALDSKWAGQVGYRAIEIAKQIETGKYC